MYRRTLILLLVSFLHIHQLAQDIRFHPDEAYFMTFARNAVVNGDWLLAGALDKPPLSIYLSALSMVLIGTTTDANGVLHLDPHIGEFAGRLPNVCLAIVLVALMMRLAHDLYWNERTTLFAGLLTATSPYLLSFGATAFTDMNLLFWLVMALWLALRQQSMLAGVALGLALWSKQQAFFYLPLIILLLLYRGRQEGNHYPIKHHITKAIGVASIIFLLLLLWDASRPETSIFLLGTINNTPDTLLVNPLSYLNRIGEWLNLSQWLLGAGWLTLILVCIGLYGGIWNLLKQAPARWLDIRFWLFVGVYLGLHTLLAFNLYDRYLLLILPPLILLCARGIAMITQAKAYLQVICTLLILSVVLTSPANIPIGGDKGDYRGIDELADYLNSKPIATVIYDRWLGWELGYYMGQWTNKRRVYYPTAQALVAGALGLEEIGDRYLVAPIDQPVAEWLYALESANFTIELDYESQRFKVYRLVVPALDA